MLFLLGFCACLSSFIQSFYLTVIQIWVTTQPNLSHDPILKNKQKTPKRIERSFFQQILKVNFCAFFTLSFYMVSFLWNWKKKKKQMFVGELNRQPNAPQEGFLQPELSVLMRWGFIFLPFSLILTLKDRYISHGKDQYLKPGLPHQSQLPKLLS